MEFILTNNQKIVLELYIYECNDFDLVFDYLRKIGVEKSEYNNVIKQLK